MSATTLEALYLLKNILHRAHAIPKSVCSPPRTWKVGVRRADAAGRFDLCGGPNGFADGDVCSTVVGKVPSRFPVFNIAGAGLNAKIAGRVINSSLANLRIVFTGIPSAVSMTTFTSLLTYSYIPDFKAAH